MNRIRFYIAQTLSAFCVLMFFVSSARPADVQALEEMWLQEVEPILENHCVKCHGGVRQQGGLDLRSLKNILRGGEQEASIVPGAPDDSLILQYIDSGEMPPPEKKRLTDEEIATLRKWIEALPAVESLPGPVDPAQPDWPDQYVRTLESMRPPSWIPPEHLSASDVIDGFLSRDWERRKIEPAPQAPPRVLARRIYLDLAGRIPTRDELEQIDPAGDGSQIDRLVDQLLSSQDYALRMREVFDAVLMGRSSPYPDERGRPSSEKRRAEHGWNAYLEHVFSTNRPWNQVVRELVAARPENEVDRGSVWFLYERGRDHQAMAEAMGPLAYGMKIDCAQCHNHPLAWEVEQRHYWGLVAAFNRSQAVETDKGPAMAESAIGGFVTFANLKKESQPAVMTFLNGTTVTETRPDPDEKELDMPELYVVPPPEQEEGEKKRQRGPQKVKRVSIPKFSRREELARTLTENNPLLARAFVNRVWALLMGRGLVHPVDQMDAKHRPSHAELLAWLSRDFEQHDYDVKRLIRSIVLSSAYQLDSRWTGETAPAPDAFARALDKPLTGEQLARSILIASGSKPDDEGKYSGHTADDIRHVYNIAFPDLFPIEYNANVSQGLFLSNSPILAGLLAPKDSNTAARLLALNSPSERIDEACQIVLGRPATEMEQAALVDHLARRSPEEGVADLLWALTSSAEFLVNH